MKLLLVSPWENRWIGYMKSWFGAKGHEVMWTKQPDPNAFLRWADCVVIGWANEHAVAITKLPKLVPTVCYLRSYELMEGAIATQVDWEKIDAQIFVNPWMQTIARKLKIPERNPHMIPNAIDLTPWPLQPHGPGKKLAFVADISFKKGLELLAQVFLALPEEYELHLAGRLYQGCQRTFGSFQHLIKAAGADRRVFMHGAVGDVATWLQDKSYLLCTSPVEGCPNNVLEAMACGIKPVIFNFPGALELFPAHLVFNTIAQAIGMIANRSSETLSDKWLEYSAPSYREYVELRFSPDILYGQLETLLLQLLETQKPQEAVA